MTIITIEELEAIEVFRYSPLTAEEIGALPGKGRHFVYSLYAIRPGVCPVMEEMAPVYVGVTSNLRQRMRAHAKRWWWSSIPADAVEFIEYPTREIADRAEMQTIRDLNPDLNVALGVGRKLRVAR